MYQPIACTQQKIVPDARPSVSTIDADRSPAHEDHVQEASEESFPASDSPAASGQDPIVLPAADTAASERLT